MSLKVIIPNFAIPEVKYSFDCLLKEFLGLEYKLEVDLMAEDFTILNNGKSIVIKNHFFKQENPTSLFHLKNIPQKTPKGVLDIGKIKYPIVSIFGTPKFNRVGETFILETDIIASTFFMLTRWEEAVNPNRDAHQRFSSKDALVYKNEFLDQPVVNQYVEIVWALLQKIEITQQRKKWNFKIVPTHDVDIPYMFSSTFSGLKSIARHLVTPNTIKDGMQYLQSFISGNDPYDTHEIFLEGAEQLGVEAHFFFMSGSRNKFDPRDQLIYPRVNDLFKQIKNRGHSIGFHPSYEAYKELSIFQEEKKRLEEFVGQEVTTGRQHYLRFEVPTTWNLWEDSNMKWESTLGYADELGFRCGVCYPFPVFDIFQRKQLNLYEKPLLFMEVTLGLYLKLPLEEAKEKVKALLQEVKKYDGEFVFLWHNSSINFSQFSKYNSILFDIYRNEM